MESSSSQDVLFDEPPVGEERTRRAHVRDKLVFRKAPHSSAQCVLVPSNVDEIIDADDPIRAFKILVYGLELREIVDTYFPFGGVGYEPRMLVAVFLYAARLGVHTVREIEKLCRYDLRFWYLTGGQIPDYSTLSRFRNRVETVDEQFFAQSVKVCRNVGLGSSGVASIDGRKTAGALDQWMRLRKDLTEEQRSGVSDPEARTLLCTRSGYVNGYSCMVGVDVRDDVVLGACVSNGASDNTSLGRLLEAIEVQNGEIPSTLVMDAGFSGSDSSAQLVARGVEAFICPKEDEFWDLDAGGQVICPAGHRLTKTNHKNLKPGERQTYRIKQCTKCPLKQICGVGKNCKTLSVQQGADPNDWVGAMVRARTPEGRQLLAYRKGSIERLFAQLFYHQKFRHFTMRGLHKAGTQLFMLCAAHNLWILASRMSELLGPQAIKDLERHIASHLKRIWTRLTAHIAAWGLRNAIHPSSGSMT